MISLNELLGLEVGDVVSTVPLMAGLSSELLQFTVASISKQGKEVEFSASFFGINVGNLLARIDGRDIVWST